MKAIFIEYIKRNLKEIILITLIIFIGLILGVIAINNLNDEKRNNIENHINKIVTSIKEYETENINKYEILKNNLKRNIIFILILGLISSSIIGIPIMYILIIAKTFSLGYTMSAITMSVGTIKGIIFICSSMMLHNIIYLVGIYIVSISGINLYKSIADVKNESIKIKIMRHLSFITIAIIFSIIAAIIETFISNTLFFILRNQI